MHKAQIGFLGAGGIARSHVYALNSLKYFYPAHPKFELSAVSSSREESRKSFAGDFGFKSALSNSQFFSSPSIDTVFIIGPNKVHYPHLKASVEMPAVKKIYLEKPVCSNKDEELAIRDLLDRVKGKKTIQVGFQFLMASAIRDALLFWEVNDFGRPLHFSFTLKHSDYLSFSYRDKRRSRLTSAPDGGAMADLGSHALSLMVAFLGYDLQIMAALQSGDFEDVPGDSDLYSEISLYDPKTGSVGNVSGSRISAGIGDMMAFEIYAEKGAISYNSMQPDRFDYFFETGGDWSTRFTGSNYKPVTSFPSGHVPSGWLRALIHAHYVFLNGDDEYAHIPDLAHGLEVQRLVRETSEHMEKFRKMTGR
ncbi:MAG: Gfo/Idh/MocA family protein [Bacteroidales bacterium]